MRSLSCLFRVSVLNLLIAFPTVFSCFYSPALRASGHVDRFTDLMVRDEKTLDCYRADKLLEQHIDKLLEDVALPSAQRSGMQRSQPEGCMWDSY